MFVLIHSSEMLVWKSRVITDSDKQKYTIYNCLTIKMADAIVDAANTLFEEKASVDDKRAAHQVMLLVRNRRL